MRALLVLLALADLATCIPSSYGRLEAPGATLLFAAAPSPRSGWKDKMMRVSQMKYQSLLCQSKLRVTRPRGRFTMQEEKEGKGNEGKKEKKVVGKFFPQEEAPQQFVNASWEGVASRLFLPPIGMGSAAIVGHHYITGPMTKNGLAGFGMDVVEVSSFTIVGLILGILTAFQFLVLDTGILYNAVQKTVATVLSDKMDRSAGRGVEEAVRSLVNSLRTLPGPQGLIFRFALDMSGVFSEPGIAKLIDDVEVRSREKGISEGKKFSSLLSVAAEGAVGGRINDFTMLLVFGMFFVVGAFDAVVLLLDKLVK